MTYEINSCLVLVIRSGDYYMFEDDSDDEESSLDHLDQLESPSETEGKVGPLEVQFSYRFLLKLKTNSPG